MKKKQIIMFSKMQSVSLEAIKLEEEYNCLKKL